MAVLALVLYVVYLLLAFGLRSWWQWRRTGSTGFRGVSGRPGSPEWWGGVLFVLALLLGVLAPALQLMGAVRPVLDGTAWHVAGVVLAVCGIGATVAAQQTMGTSWRIGVDEQETTTLVTGGVFRWVRNPIFTAMVTAAAGLTLLAPNPLAFAGLAALVVAIQLQVRSVEEPYLRRTHGERYLGYAGHAGRFVPGMGRLKS